MSTPRPVAALPESLLSRFTGRKVAIRLLFGDEIEGWLSTVGRFEMLVTLADGAVVCIFKGAVASIRETPGPQKPVD